MALVVNDTIGNINLWGYITTTTTTTTATTTSTEDDHGCNWNKWSPVVDWEELSGDHVDFNDLIESMMDNDNNCSSCFNQLQPTAHHEVFDSSVVSPETVMEDVKETNTAAEDANGLRLVHLLMAAAEALTGVYKSRDLARVILVRLKELVSPFDGTNIERLAAYFTEALQGLLDGAHDKYMPTTAHHQSDFIAAFQLLQDMSPYVKFGHFTANQAILEAVALHKRVHIVDYDIMEGIQWASLMQALVSRKDGPPTPHLRITALSRGGGSGRRSFGTVQETGRRLISFAVSIGQPFSFHLCRLDSDEKFKPSSLKLVRGEALVINCMLHLPHFTYRAPDSVTSLLSGVKTLNPRLVTLVEEVTRPVGDGGLVSRFMDSMHYYSAVFDSLEAGFPMQSRARELVERVILGPRISGSLGRIYHAGGLEDGCSWEERSRAIGFRPVNISFANHCQAKLLLGLFNDGYRVEELSQNKLVLGWKSRRLLSASIWTSPGIDL